MRPECEKLTGRRQRAICEGTADLPEYKINGYRSRWGLEPLDLSSKAIPRSGKVRTILDKIAKKSHRSKKQSKHISSTQVKKIASGPGTELSNLLSEFGIKPRTGCSCNLLIDTMNSLGPEGCKQNKEKLLTLMRENQDKYGWGTYLRAGFNAVRTGWVFKLNPMDPLPQLFDEAIKRAEQDQ